MLKSALSLLKQTVLIKMYVFVTSKHVNSDNLVIYGFPEAIFKILAIENKKANIRIVHRPASICHKFTLFTYKCILLRVINLM